MILDLTPEEFRDKLNTLCDDKPYSFSSYGRKMYQISRDPRYFYGLVTNNTFELYRNSQGSRNSYVIKGTYSPTNDGRTHVDYKLTYDKKSYWAIRLMPLAACLIADPLIYFKTDMGFEGMMFINTLFLFGFIYVPIDVYRGRKMLTTFKKEFNIHN